MVQAASLFNKRLALLAALLLLGGLLTACAGGSGPSTPSTSQAPTATISPDTQAYLSLLQTYYMPWERDHFQQQSQCGPGFDQAPPVAQALRLPDCRPVLVSELAAGKTLISQLTTAHPPASWQTAHAALRQAMQVVDTYDTQRLHAIEASNVSQFVALSNGAPQVLALFCGPIHLINVGPPASNFPVPDSCQ
jgi:hypothetical protein